ncbi:MAG: hypothetical protein E6H08_05975 [Bacteroidetes bacterium]|nr:MAG: hypothetical protein E6H08_05975 [Bacteroidota bacterium]
MATLREDDLLKAACHGLLFGCTLPVLAYNASRKNHKNVFIYLALLSLEIFHITGHMRDAEKNKKA